MNERLNKRQDFILNMLSREGEVRIPELSQLFDVSEMTIRRDLEKLEQSGFARRTFGGAIPLLTNEVALRERAGVMVPEKTRIGRRAAELIHPGQAVFIDGGTTTPQVARHLAPSMDITVVTNALNVATELIDKHITTIVTGGTLREETSALVGPSAEEPISNMSFDVVFLGASGITAENGLSNSNVFEANIKKMVISRASEVVIVADHTKFGVRSLALFARLNEIHRIVTDEPPENPFTRACEEAGVEIIQSN